MANSLSVNYNMVLLAMLAIVDDIVYDPLLVVIVFLRKKNILCAVGDAAPKCNIACISSHNLNNAAALMRGGCIANLVDGLHGGIDGRVKADCIFCAGNIQINGSWKSDGIDSLPGQGKCSAVRAVAADNNQSVNAMLAADVGSCLLAFLRPHLLAARCPEHRAAPLDDIRHAVLIHIDNLLLEESGVAAFNPLYRKAVLNGSSHTGTNGRVHTGCIAAAGKYTNCLRLIICHNYLPIPQFPAT